MTGSRGLTVVELTATLAVVAVLTAVGVPRLLAALPSFRANAAARQLVADFRLARALAVDRGRAVFLRFHSPARDEYTLAVDTHPTDAGDGRLTPDDETVKVVGLPQRCKGVELTPYAAGSGLPADGVSFDDNLAVFSPQGTSNGGSAYVRPAADEGLTRLRERRVTVLASTGRARAYRWTGSRWE